MRARESVVLALAALILLAALLGSAPVQRGQAAMGQPFGALAAPQAHKAQMLPPETLPDPASAHFDEQLGVTFTQNFTALSYSVTAVEQVDSVSGTGPAYLLNGLTSAGYWYQVGLAWDWTPGYGFGMAYEVFGTGGTSIFPTNGGGGLVHFSGTINAGDSVQLELYFSGGDVVMAAIDHATGATASESYSAEGSGTFVGLGSGPASSQGYFTGLMTEWYHANPYHGNGEEVVYSQSVALSSGWMWMDEFDASNGSVLFSSCDNSCAGPTSWSNPTLLKTFSSNGSTIASDAYEFITGYSVTTVALTFSYSVQGGGSGYLTPVLNYVSGGKHLSANLTIVPTAYDVDPGSNWNVSAVLPGSSSSEQWATPQSTTGQAGSAQTIDFVYYNQVQVTFAMGILGGGVGYMPPSVSYTQFGSQTTTATGSEVWADAGSAYSYPNPLSGSTSSERWFAGAGTSGTAESAGTITVVYYHQYALSVSYLVYGGGSPSPPTFSSVYLGQSKVGPLTGLLPGHQQVEWADAGSAYGFLPLLSSSTSTERWCAETVTGTADGAVGVSASYYHQFDVTVSYAVEDGGEPAAPSLQFYNLSLPASYEVTEAPTQVWMDVGNWSAPAALAGSGASERWMAPGEVNGSVTSGTTISVTYFHQFSLLLSYDVSDASTPLAPVLLSTEFGDPLNASLQRTATAYWMDSGAAWTASGTLKGSGPAERWVARGPVGGTASSFMSLSIEYLHQYQVSLASAQAEGGTVPASGWYNASSSVKLVAHQAAGWQFDGWTGAGSGSYTGTENGTLVEVLSSFNESAVFYPGVTLTNGGNGELSYSWSGGRATIGSGSVVVYVPSGTRLSINATPSTFFTFGGYSGAAAGRAPSVSVLVTTPVAVTATFSLSYLAIGGMVAVAILAVLGAVVFFVRRRRCP